LLRVDKNARLVKLPFSLPRLFTGRRAFVSGKRTFDARWSKAAIEGILAKQRKSPVPLVRTDTRAYWIFEDCFYWEDEGLTTDDVRALVLQRTRRRERQLATAHSLMRAEEEGRQIRTPVPVEVRRAVFERDGGRCVECGSGFDLQYDHIIPHSLGGAAAVANLQLLCGDCNRKKGAAL
jgi:HNH endonuclease